MPQRIAAILMLLWCGAAQAQPVTQPSTQPVPPRYLAHLITMSPGQLVYERFGHNAIFITDLTQSPVLTVAYDFGNFDFNEADFVYRFLFGEMRYWAEEKDAGEMLYGYLMDNRQVYRQELNLTDAQVLRLWQRLKDNVREENRFYPYDYYRDNCSTRLRDHLDAAFDGKLSAQLKAAPGEHTYRWLTRVGMDNDRALLAGIEFAASGYVDREIARWDECFLPEQLRQSLDALTVRDAGGSLSRVVRRSGAMNNAIRDATFVKLPSQPALLWPWFALAGAAVGAALALCGVSARRGKIGRWLAALVWGGWGLFAGLGGSLLIFMWFFTRHVGIYRNENLLQLSPLALALVVIGPMAAFGRSLPTARRVALVLLALSIIGLLLKVLPMMSQHNYNTIVFAVLANAGLFGGVVLRSRNAAVRAVQGVRE